MSPLSKKQKCLLKEPDFKGYIHDVGGPTANFRAPACEKQIEQGSMPEQTVSVSKTLQESDQQTTAIIWHFLKSCEHFRR